MYLKRKRKRKKVHVYEKKKTKIILEILTIGHVLGQMSLKEGLVKPCVCMSNLFRNRMLFFLFYLQENKPAFLLKKKKVFK